MHAIKALANLRASKDCKYADLPISRNATDDFGDIREDLTPGYERKRTYCFGVWFTIASLAGTLQAGMSKHLLHCPFCARTSPHGAGLASHVRSAHPNESKSYVPGQTASTGGTSLTGGLKEAIAGLEQRGAAIERALAALRAISGSSAEKRVEAAPVVKKASAAHKRGITAAGRRRLAEAMKRRWAVKRTAAQAGKRSARAAA
jgi:hypothetical protein